jgi:undecaprenyl-diphosphatase
VYLTLGAILAEVVTGRWTRSYCLLLPALVVFAVGLSRVYIGVHYPTDVIGGWALGTAWALLCWAVAHYLEQRGLLRRWLVRRDGDGEEVRASPV